MCSTISHGSDKSDRDSVRKHRDTFLAQLTVIYMKGTLQESPEVR